MQFWQKYETHIYRIQYDRRLRAGRLGYGLRSDGANREPALSGRLQDHRRYDAPAAASPTDAPTIQSDDGPAEWQNLLRVCRPGSQPNLRRYTIPVL